MKRILKFLFILFPLVVISQNQKSNYIILLNNVSANNSNHSNLVLVNFFPEQSIKKRIKPEKKQAAIQKSNVSIRNNNQHRHIKIDPAPVINVTDNIQLSQPENNFSFENIRIENLSAAMNEKADNERIKNNIEPERSFKKKQVNSGKLHGNRTTAKKRTYLVRKTIISFQKWKASCKKQKVNYEFCFHFQK